MKQGRGIESDWQEDSETPRRRWLRRLRWTVGLVVVVALGQLTGVVDGWLPMLALLTATVAGVFIWRAWTARRGQRRWRRDSALVVPSLPNPVSRISVPREWTWPSSPMVRAPLAIALIGALYWAVVMNGLQLPPHQLFAVILLALVNLWCWHEPLLLVLIVIPGVTVLALLGWLIQTFTLVGAIGVVVGLSVVVALTVAEIRKRLNRNHPWQ
jgi:hypothetical protein